MPEKCSEFELEIQQLIHQAMSQQAAYEQQRNILGQKLQEIEAELLSYERTLNAYQRQKGTPQVEEPSLSGATLRAMSVADGMHRLINDAGGKEKIAKIAKKLFAVGKLKNQKTANSHIRAVMKRGNRFVFIGNGMVGLVSAETSRTKSMDESYAEVLLTPANTEQQSGYKSTLLDLSRKGKYAYMTVAAALIRFFIERENQESPTTAIFEHLIENGLEIGGKNPVSNLTAVLHTDKRFESVRRGLFRLKPEAFQNLKESGLKLRLKIEEVK